jgi:alpha-L-rhamnosidase
VDRALDLEIQHLRCEYLVNPLGIDDPAPRLSWVLASNQRGQRQTAYQILVASSSERLSADDGDLWDSGKVESSQSTQLIYAGVPLQSRQACYWKVRVWDKDGVPAAYGDAASWEMGLRAEDWRGQWIGARAETLPDLQPSPYLRKTFSLDKPLRKARIYATAKGVYELRLNGMRVGNAFFAPGWTDYDLRIQYQTYDVTGLIQHGYNALGAVLGAGWYCGYVGYENRMKNYGARPQLLLQLYLTYEDGSEELIVSDERWRASTNGAIRYSDIQMGEFVDARMELNGWDTSDYDDSAWEPASTRPLNSVALVADRAEPVMITEELTPKSISVVNNAYVVDMGQNMVGWARLRVQGDAGTQITLRFVEMLNEDGSIYTENLRAAKQIDTYILKGGGVEIFEPRFTFHGFRYIEVTGYPETLTPDAIVGCVIHSATPLAGTFTCSNEMVNQLQRNIVWGQRGNFLSVPTDCPQRNERLGWLGDAQVFIRTACSNMDTAAFFTKWMFDIEDAQGTNGSFPCVAPRFNRLDDGCPAWGDGGVIVPWTMYRVYGDTRMIERHWRALERWMDYLQQANPDYLWVARLTRNYGDWLSINADTPKDVLGTAYFAYDAALMAEMAAAIGRAADAEKYQHLFEAIKAAFIDVYVDSDGRIKGETQTVYVLALHMNLLPDDLRPKAAAHLVENIERCGGHLSTGFVGVSYLCPVLSENGYPDVAYRLLTNDTFPSWGYSVKQGATTIWERWDAWTHDKGFQDKGMNSFNHYALGSIGQWLFQAVAGIEIGQPGYTQILLRPRIGGGVSYARAEYDSMHGKIRSAWQIEAGELRLSVSVPTNTTALIAVPTTSADSVREGNVAARAAEGVTFVREEADGVVFALESGSYKFVSRL